jgi:hypothetical protein
MFKKLFRGTRCRANLSCRRPRSGGHYRDAASRQEPHGALAIGLGVQAGNQLCTVFDVDRSLR